MATLPKTSLNSGPRNSMDDAAARMAALVEEYFDEIGLPEEQRNARVAEAGEFISSAVAAPHAK
jgi:hypothetical protein